jgi:hypothetical protein
MNGREALSRVLAIASEALDEAEEYNVLHGKGSITIDEYPFGGDKESAKEQHEYDSECVSTAGNIVWRIEADEEY